MSSDGKKDLISRVKLSYMIKKTRQYVVVRKLFIQDFVDETRVTLQGT